MRDRQALQRGHGSVFAVAVADHQGTDLVAILPLGNAVATLDDGAGAFQAGDVRRAGRHRIAPHALQAIGAVHAGGGDADQHFARFRFGHRADARDQHLRTAGRIDLDDCLGGRDIGKQGRSSRRVDAAYSIRGAAGEGGR